MKVYHDEDADLGTINGKRIAVIGYGNQGRAQALNLRDSGLEVIIGNRPDEYADQAADDGFTVHPIARAVAEGDLVFLLIPDEVLPELWDGLDVDLSGKVLVFASGYNVAFDLIELPPACDVVLVAPRMIGAGVRDLYAAGRGFPAFIGVARDHSGQAHAIALALAKGIGATHMGVVEVTFAQEAELDLFTEQCFGPAFGQVLTTSVDLLIEEGYPPEAVLLELYMSGEFAYTLSKIAEMGMIEQSQLHSRTSQYGSMSRGMRFILPELRTKMWDGLDEIRSGAFAREWAAEQAAGSPTLETLRQAARSLPMHQMEHELRRSLRGLSDSLCPTPRGTAGGLADTAGSTADAAAPAAGNGLVRKGLARLRRACRHKDRGERAPVPLGPLTAEELAPVLRRFVDLAAGDAVLKAFSHGKQMTTHYVLTDTGHELYMHFQEGNVTTGLGAPPEPATIRLEATADTFDGMFTGRINPMRAAMSGKLTFYGDAKLAIGLQQIQNDLCRLYTRAQVQFASTALRKKGFGTGLWRFRLW